MSRWFITGCSTGIGREIGRAALEARHSVAVTARETASVADFVEEFGDRALALPLDVTDRVQITVAAAAANVSPTVTWTAYSTWTAAPCAATATRRASARARAQAPPRAVSASASCARAAS